MQRNTRSMRDSSNAQRKRGAQWGGRALESMHEGRVGERVREQERARAPLLRAARGKAKAVVAHFLSSPLRSLSCFHASPALTPRFVAGFVFLSLGSLWGGPMPPGRRYCDACPLWLMVFLSCGHGSISLVAPPSRHLQTAPADASALRRYPWCGLC